MSNKNKMLIGMATEVELTEASALSAPGPYTKRFIEAGCHKKKN